MRHLKAGRKLGRNSSHRKAMFRNMVTSLLYHGQIKTTLAKAKELRRHVEKMITIGRNHPESSFDGLDGADLVKAKASRLHAIRRARRVVNNKQALQDLFGKYAEIYKDRPGGYTRVIKAGFRPGDNAPMAVISLVMTDDVDEVSSDENPDENTVDPSADQELLEKESSE
jgi:large subunit ribosomal protein L17